MASSQFHFRKGMEVEAFSDDKDLRGALFVATVLRSVTRRNKVLIEYQTLVVDEEGTKPLREFVDVVYLRPIPPREADRSFDVSDLVDAYHNDAWWEGVVIRVVEKGRYLVYFRTGKEELEFEQSEMRIHREWVRGVWVPAMEEDVPHVQHEKKEQDTTTLHDEADVKTDQAQSSYANDSADIVNRSNKSNHKIELPSCNNKISSPCKKLKKAVSKRSLVREPVPRFGKEKTGGVLGYDRSAGRPMLDDFSLSPVYHIEEHCKSSRSQVQLSQDNQISQSCKKLKKENETGSSFLMTHPEKEMSTGAIPSPLDELKEKIASGLHYDRLHDFSLSTLCNSEEHCVSSKSQVQYSENNSVAQPVKKLKKRDETGSSSLTTHPAKGLAIIAIPSPSSKLSAHLELKEKTRSALDYGRSGGHPMLDGFNLSPLYNIEEHRKLSKSRVQSQSCKKSKKGDEPGSSFPMTHRSKKMCRSAIRIGSDFDYDMSATDATFDDFGLSPLLDIEEDQSDSCTKVHCSQNNLIQY